MEAVYSFKTMSNHLQGAEDGESVFFGNFGKSPTGT
jgi:hypothetical protein